MGNVYYLHGYVMDGMNVEMAVMSKIVLVVQMDFLIAVAILQSVTTILKGNAMVLLTVQMGKMNIFVP